MMWGKILLLAKVGYQEILNEQNSEAEYVRLKKSAGQDSNRVEHFQIGIPVKEIYGDLQNLLDLFLIYNKDKDPNSLLYVPAAKQYYKLVSIQKMDYEGILMVGTENNVQHPVFKPGDIVIERKGKKINRMDDYSKLKDDPSPNIVKIIRFNSTNTESVITEKIPDTKILVGFTNLKSE